MDRDASLDEFLTGTRDEPSEESPRSDRADDEGVTDDPEQGRSGTEGVDATVPVDGEAGDGDEDRGIAGDERAERESAAATGARVVAVSRATPEPTSCPACNEPARRRWHQDGKFVCERCKDWKN